MLDSLDTLIAFVTIMMICSLFVLIVVQMIAAALSLRGKNFANALGLTFQTLAPTLTADAHKLAQKILADPLLSDSMLPGKDRSEDQTATRGKPWTFFGMFDGAMRLANAIRPDEVYAALKKISAGDDASMKAAADKVLAAFAGDSAQTLAVKSKLAALTGIGDSVLTLAADQASKDEIMKTIREASGQLVTEIDGERERLERWINVAQDRAEQWFRTHTRGVTIAASIAFALFCQIDAVEVYQHVTTDAAGREALVKAGAKLIEEGSPAAPASTPSAEPQAQFEAQKKKLAELQAMTDAAGFQLMPTTGWRWQADKVRFWSYANWCSVLPHMPGILLFAGLLTLGAPYWFNLLKNLSSLRPALAQLIGEEKKADAEKKAP